MRIDMDAFPKHTYIGKDWKDNSYTKGNEYSRVLISNWFHDNTLGVYMTTEDYEGDDEDFCCFFSMKEFNKNFSPGIPPMEFPPRGENLHKEYLKRKKKLNIVKIKYGKSYVEKTLKEGRAGELYSLNYKCTCATCENPNPVREERKIAGLKDRIKEFQAGEYLEKE